jgi:hypothetical protein
MELQDDPDSCVECNRMYEQHFCEYTNLVNENCEQDDPMVIKYHKLYRKAIKHAVQEDYAKSNWYYLKLINLCGVNY